MNSPTMKRSKQCDRKRRYDSAFDARMGMVENHGKRSELNVYLCPHCVFWHVGHRPARFIVANVGAIDCSPGGITMVRP